jgi:mycofactocin system glycosyltransferase
MSQLDKSSGQRAPLAYRLRRNVSLTENGDALHLCLSYPLKFVSLNLFWRPAMVALSKGSYIPLNEILSTTGDQSKEKIEFFLNDLVRKGFLEQTGISKMETLPSISIIIPVFNRAEDISACLDSLLILDYPKDKLEIIVVDDASTDDTPVAASHYPVQLIRNAENRQAPYCRNLGAEKARGDILAFIDSDCRADRTWLRELVPAFKDLKIAAVGGMVESYYNTRPLDRYEQVRSSLKMGVWPKRSANNNPFFYVPSCNLLVRRDIFLQTGGFNESLAVGEDVDLCWRIHNFGSNIDYLPNGRVFHKHRNRLAAFCRRRFDYGTSEPLLNRLHPGKVKQIVFAPGASMFWMGLILAVLLKSAWLLLLPAAILWFEAIFKSKKVKQKGFSISAAMTAISVARGYAAFIYHCCSFFSRYYLIWFIAIGPILTYLAAMLTGMHLLTGVVEYNLKKPNLGLIRFLVYFTMEQLSYQSGVWWQCLKLLSFKSVNPRVTARILHES